MGVFLGFDPGGARTFGWCVAEGERLPLHILSRGVAEHAQGALHAACASAADRSVRGIGIDAPLFWRCDGDRRVDQVLRQQILQFGSKGGTVNSVNSMRGACLVQGVLLGMLARQTLEADVRISESHPKAALWLLRQATRERPPGGIELSQLSTLFVGDTQGASDHERDAAIGALSAFAMTVGLQGWHDLFILEPKAVTPIPGPIGYWMPQ